MERRQSTQRGKQQARLDRDRIIAEHNAVLASLRDIIQELRDEQRLLHRRMDSIDAMLQSISRRIGGIKG